MTEKELREKFAPRKCASQIEFDHFLHEINDHQRHANHPLLDEERQLLLQYSALEQQRRALQIQIEANKMQRKVLEQKRKDINRVYADIKHELIELNPKE